MATWLRRALAIAITLGLLAWLLLDARLANVVDAGRRLDALTVGAVLVALFLSYCVRAQRIVTEFRSLINARYSEVLRVVLMHNAWVNILPFRAGELAFPLLMRSRFGVAVERSAASLLWLRVQDACVLALAAALALPRVPLATRLGIAAVVLAGTIALWVLARTRRPLGRPVLEKLRAGLAAATGSPWQTWLWTVLNWAIKLAALALLLAALLPAPAMIAFSGALGAEAAAVLPVQGVAGFGTYEAGAAAMLVPAGVALRDALPAALVMHLVVIASALLAGLWAWGTMRTRPTSPAS
jgi:uncharacterized membrane protein YbhN (UPF0104 family)